MKIICREGKKGVLTPGERGEKKEPALPASEGGPAPQSLYRATRKDLFPSTEKKKGVSPWGKGGVLPLLSGVADYSGGEDAASLPLTEGDG